MRIAIEVNPLCRELGTGISRYVESLVWTWPQVEPDDELVLFHRNHRRLQHPVPPRYEVRGYSERGMARLLGDRSLRDVDVVHHTRNRLALETARPSVVSLFDVFHLTPAADKVGGDREASATGEHEDLVRRKPWVITVSRHSRAEILATMALEAERVAVVYPGVDGKFHPADANSIRDARAAYRIDGDYLLFAGALTERKNLGRVLEAFAELDRRTGGRFRLVLAGAGREHWERRVPEPIRGRVVFAGFARDSDLPALYSGARLMLWPSLHEGFGLPVLEAMACACPVLTSRGTACEEVAGDAALLVDPLDTKAIADAAAGLLENPDLAARLRERGLARAHEFNWGAAIRGTREVYARAIEEAGGAGRR